VPAVHTEALAGRDETCRWMAREPALLYVSQPLLRDECPPTYSTDIVPNMAITSVANTFSVTICGSSAGYIKSTNYSS